MAGSSIETFQRSAQVSCPYPFCGGDTEEGRCRTCGRESLPCTRADCLARNRIGAVHCRQCGVRLPEPPEAAWPMHGGNAHRTGYRGDLRGQPVLGEQDFLPLPEYGLNTESGDCAHPLALPMGLVLPNFRAQGFSLFMPTWGAKGTTTWTSSLWCRPGASATPVLYRSNLYTCCENDGLLLFARISVDTGEAEFMEKLQAPPSPKQTPVAVSSNGGGMVAWPLRSAAALYRFTNGKTVPDGEVGRQLIVARVTELDAAEYLMSPVEHGDSLLFVSRYGRIFGLAWDASYTALRLRGLRQRAALKGDWICGPPVHIAGLGTVFLGADFNLDGTLHLIVFNDAGELQTVPLEIDKGREFVGREDAVLDMRPWCDGSNVLVPGSQRNGVHIINASSNGSVQSRWKETPQRLTASPMVATHELVAGLTDGNLFICRDFYNEAALQRQVSSPLTYEGAVQTPLAEPVLGNGAIYIMCNGYLARIPLR